MGNKYFVLRDQCPACESDTYRDIYQKPYDEPPIKNYLESAYSAVGEGVEFHYLENANYHLCECNECGLIFQKEIPNNFLMDVLYEKWIDPQITFENHKQIDDLMFYSNYSQEISTIIEYFHKVPSKLQILDFGMGWGKWALMAKAFGCESFGAELSDERIKYAESNGIKVVSWKDIPTHSFDFINTEQVFEHISSPLETLSYLKSALKRNGILKISVPTANDINRRLLVMDWNALKGTRNSLNPLAPLEHINYFRRESLKKMAALAGMEDITIPMKIQYIHSSNWGGIRRIARNLLLPIYRNVLKRQNYLFFRNK